MARGPNKPKLLKAMNYVMVNSDPSEDGPFDKIARKMLEESPLKFADTHHKMELAVLDGKIKKEAAAAAAAADLVAESEAEADDELVTEDIGLQKCLELAEKCVRELAEKHK